MTWHTPRLLDRLSLVARLMLAVTLSFAVAALAVLYLTTHYAAINAKIELSNEYQHELEHLSRALAPALLAHNAESLKSTLEGLRRSPAVTRVGFRDVSDSAGFSRETPAILTAPAWFVRLCDTQRLGGTQPLTVDGVYFGLLTLDLSPIPSINLAWERTQRQLGILALALGLVFISIWLVLRHGLKPLQALQKGTQVLSDGDYSVRLETQGSPELRNNIAEFNRMAIMLEQAQKRNAETLSSSNKQLQQQGSFANALLRAQASAGICLAVVDGETTISANKAALDILGLKREDLGRKTISDMLDAQHRSEFDRQYSRVLQGETLLSPRVEIKLTTPDGVERWLEVAIFGISRDDNRLVAILGLDITQRKHDSEQLMAAHEILRTQKDEAERANEAKSRFLAAASHDLRQPLHALALFSGRLQDLTTTPEQGRLASQIDAAVGNVSELLESLLDISKIDLTTTRPDVQAIELNRVFEQVVSAHRHEADAKQLRLRFAKTSLWALSDPSFFSRIVSNLVSNAIRYTEQGAILVGARRAGGKLRIEIWDTGIGIDEKHLPLLFQEFYQVANPERDTNKGLGLGLAIVDRLANLLGHKIGLRSRPGAGSVFSILVPRAKAEDAARNSWLTGKPGISILFASDNETQQIELAQMLDRWGYAVTLCKADEIALMLSALSHDLVITDQSCLDCLDRCRSTTLADEIPVICVMDEKELPQTTGTAHSCSALVSSTKPAQLRAVILHLLAQKKAMD